MARVFSFSIVWPPIENSDFQRNWIQADLYEVSSIRVEHS